jgi:superfamily II DNA or RNA helicase
MMATIRNRRAVISRVKPFDGDQGRLHLVELEYTDLDGGKGEDSVIWEREIGARLVEPGALPDVHSEAPMAPRDFDALIRASRWAALTPFLAADGSNRPAELPLASPFHGAVQVEDFQLVPLLKALQMPRISLLLADDVGLGKTIEAGLILTELLLRRRIRRVLILSPASLRDQWREEMQDKFSLTFDIVDRQETHQLRKRLGLDANPWRTFPRIITSYHYLRQHDVLQQFLAAARQRQDAAQLPWDLLIVDEAHNLMPAPYGADSDLSKMLRTLSPLFEHKLFLTATPHNGHTRSFSGLLEQLDPVRFNQTSEFTQAEKERVSQVVVRRLKSEINDLDDEKGKQPRFPFRELQEVPLRFTRQEMALSEAFSTFRTAVKSAIAKSARGEQLAGSFAIEVLNKRLLSSPFTFADSWYRFLDGTQDDEDASQGELFAARRASEEDVADDQEKEGRGRHAARTAGAWLKPFLSDLKEHVDEVNRCLEALGIKPGEEHPTPPTTDARFDSLVKLIETRLREGRRWNDQERLIIFTEYKTTLDDLNRRLVEKYGDDTKQPERIRVLFGGMPEKERKAIRTAFNDEDDPVRVLLATDAASEGLNLQETARLLLHYEVPWNPSRLEQRNGRLDRHGQARDVTVYHFTSDDDADLRFLGRVVEKVHQIREDLGTLGEVFDAAFQRRFMDLEDADAITDELDRTVETERREMDVRVDNVAASVEGVEQARIDRLCSDIDLSPDTLRDTLEVALGMGVGQPRLEGPDARSRFKLKQPIPERWKPLIEDNLRLPYDGSKLSGAIPWLVFSADHFIEEKLGRPVFRPANDTKLLHLGHPMFRHALANFARLRFPGGDDRVSASRWAVREGPTPDGADALLLLTVEELAVNALREPFHHWVRTLRIPVVGDELGDLLPYASPEEDSGGREAPSSELVGRARELWLDLAADVKELVARRRDEIGAKIEEALDAGRERAVADADRAYTHRIEEVRSLAHHMTVKKLEREIEADKRARQLELYAEHRRALELDIKAKEFEVERRKKLAEEQVDLLVREKARVTQHLLPQRFSLRGGGVQVFPLAVEVRFKGAAR